MSGNVFFDSNTLIYAIDSSPEGSHKSAKARRLIRDHIQNGSGVISVQVIQEFYVVATQKIAFPLSSDQALEYLNYLSIMEIVKPDYEMVVTAVHIHKRFQISFWDAMIIQAAAFARCDTILSEDLQDGFKINGLRVLNPFT